jgi:hypothetical protein
METQDSGGELSIRKSNRKREHVAAATYEAAYKNLFSFMDDHPKWGKKMKARLYFVIVNGPEKGKTISFKGGLLKDDAGDWFVGAKSKLADAIRTVTGGDEDIGDRHRGRRVLCSVKNGEGASGPYHYIEKLLPATDGGRPTDESRSLTAKRENRADGPTGDTTPEPDAETNGHQQPVAAAVTNGGGESLLNELTELSDFG